ncbi:uncharacterized protein LOC141543984 [Sminthopsis crassicaudata]|uniref:uncharacterized protein LOC141543984 n=1 Tax=Sminthopsis crassicaudata TaxID=9301 RepID=UPI003D68ACA9
MVPQASCELSTLIKNPKPRAPPSCKCPQSAAVLLLLHSEELPSHPKPAAQLALAFPMSHKFIRSSQTQNQMTIKFRKIQKTQEKEKKKSDVLVDVRGKKITRETRNIPYPLQAHKTSKKCAVRKALEEDDDTVSSWDSEEYPKDSEVEEKKSDMLVDNNTSKETTSETPHIPSEQQAHSISEKSAARKRLEKEEDTKSLWDSKVFSIKLF